MKQIDLLLQARQGDPIAIGQLLSQALKMKPSEITVHLKQGKLQVMLRRATPRPFAITTIHHSLQPIGKPLIQQVRVVALPPNAPAPLWVETFPLSPTPPLGHAHAKQSTHSASKPVDLRTTARPSPSKPRLPLRSPLSLHQWMTQKPQPRQWWPFLQAHFDRFKLGIIGLVALYGLLGSRSYNVIDFMEGSNRIMMFIHGVNLIFHEAGHIIFMLFGSFMHVLGGSLNQILIPALISGYFFITGQRFSSAIALAWVGENFWDVSIYIKDASAMELPLLGGEGVLHDWNTLLEDLGLLQLDQLIGNLFFAIGSIIYLSAIGLGVYSAWLHDRSTPTPPAA
ncbi:hypothetical protein [Alkalinema sp. FACHB-956]|uniref:hypothetical protein n=1 Tax=Alkalinema sp. FACHB-956 TaxID=2692768 RepID=UPI00168435D6|nr:hypothetical protein [Alkalinema sp. FACHB-956]MBD2329320.1 hypothetical protein [Alkalinema sp. FACHB-956]